MLTDRGSIPVAVVLIGRMVLSSLLLLALGAPLTAGADRPKSDSIDLPFDQWVRGRDRRDIPWEVRLGVPQLTYQQRFAVSIYAKIPVPGLLKAGVSGGSRVVVRVADESGAWVEGEDSVQLQVDPQQLRKVERIDVAAGVMLRPGKYTVAVLLYDPASGKGNLERRPLTIPRLDNDPLPDLDGDLRSADFPDELSNEEPRLSTGMAADTWAYAGLAPGAWAFGRGAVRLPVVNARPLVVDIVMDFSHVTVQEVETRVATWQSAEDEAYFQYRKAAIALLQMGNVISQMGLRRGCIRLSAVDVRAQAIILDRVGVSELDWRQLRTKLDVKGNPLNDRALPRPAELERFLGQYLSRLAADSNACGLPAKESAHVVVVLRPDGRPWKSPSDGNTGEYSRLSDGRNDDRVYRVEALVWPDPGRVLESAPDRAPCEPGKLASYRVDSPWQFRRVLAKTVADLESTSKP